SPDASGLEAPQKILSFITDFLLCTICTFYSARRQIDIMLERPLIWISAFHSMSDIISKVDSPRLQTIGKSFCQKNVVLKRMPFILKNLYNVCKVGSSLKKSLQIQQFSMMYYQKCRSVPGSPEA